MYIHRMAPVARETRMLIHMAKLDSLPRNWLHAR